MRDAPHNMLSGQTVTKSDKNTDKMYQQVRMWYHHLTTQKREVSSPSRTTCTQLDHGKLTALSFYLSSLSSSYVFVIHSLQSGSPKEACCHLICSDII